MPTDATTQRTRMTPPVSLYVSIATVPGRERDLAITVETLLHQSRLPDKVLIVFPRAFTWRAVGTSNALRGVVNTSALPRHDHVELVHCPRDDGPGTKLLCAEHHLRQAERNARRDGQQHPLPTRTSSAPRWLVLADDDRAYKPWALMEVERAILASADHTHDSYSFHTQPLWFPHVRSLDRKRGDQCWAPCECSPSELKAHRCTARQYVGDRSALAWPTIGLPRATPPALVIGYGISLFAMPLALTTRALGFFRCAVGYSALLARHDDFWISSYLLFEHNVTISRLRGPLGRGKRVMPVSSATVKATHSNWDSSRGRDTAALRFSNDSIAVLAASARHFYDLSSCTTRRHNQRSERRFRERERVGIS